MPLERFGDAAIVLVVAVLTTFGTGVRAEEQAVILDLDDELRRNRRRCSDI